MNLQKKELRGQNTVIYPNAFDNLSADIRYRYTGHSLEQDTRVRVPLRRLAGTHASPMQRI